MAGELLGNFTITVPVSPRESDYTGDRSALFVPTEDITGLEFSPSQKTPNVRVTRNPESVLDAVFSERKFGNRRDTKGEKGLENDPSRQQMIVYTFITSGDSILFYRRAGQGDSRLSGNASIGFGGHTEFDDAAEIATLVEKEESGEFVELKREDASLRLGIDRELTEELGLTRDDIKLSLAGAFYETFTEKELEDKIPVGAVHTCLIAIGQLESDVRRITLQDEEVALAEWVKIADIRSKLESLKSEGVGVDNWTDIGLNEFEEVLADLSSREAVNLPEIVIK